MLAMVMTWVAIVGEGMDMDIEITAFAPSLDIEVLHTTLERMGFSSCSAREGSHGLRDGHLELLYVADQRPDAPDVCNLLDRRDAPFNLLVADEQLYCTDQLLNHALDFCRWPVDDLELSARLKRAAQINGRAETCGQGLPSADDCLQMNLIGRSPAFLEVLWKIQRLAQVDANLLITGETGTGKELAARALHYLGPRRGKCFQAINCGAIPESLVENELFGHVSGAYTDARQTKIGLIEQSCDGTLFLDEVDMLSLKAQSALLHFIESRAYRPLGACEERNTEARIIAATNADLKELAARGQFRLDLFYRLNLLTLPLPPLRQRGEDTLLLVEHFLGQCEIAYGRGCKVLHPYTRAQLLTYDWPGNIRELEHFIQREYLLAESSVIAALPDSGSDSLESCYQSEPLPTNFKQAKEQAINQFERQYIHAMLGKTAGNVTRAAELAGKERRAFGKLVKKHGIDPKGFARSR